MNDNPLVRIAILADGDCIPAWLGEALREVLNRGLGEIVLIVERSVPETPIVLPGRLRRWWQNRRLLAFALFERLDRRRAAPAPPEQSLRKIAPSAARIVVSPRTTQFTDELTDEDLAKIRAHAIDVAIRAGFRILKGGILGVARHGVWSFHHGDNRSNRGGPPGVWEVLQDDFVTGVTLQRLTAELDGGDVLARSVGATVRFSIARNLRALYPRSATMLVRSIDRLYSGRSPIQATGSTAGDWLAYSRRLYRRPKNAEVVQAVAQVGRKYISRRLAWRGKRPGWSIAWHYSGAAHGNVPYPVLHRYKEITSGSDRFWADPFVVFNEGRWWMFFEELIYATGLGTIRVQEMTANGPVGSPMAALERPYHLSYPHVFRYDDSWYMLPESAAARRVELYRAVDFPTRWVLDRVILDNVDAVDSTMHLHEGKWYLFTSLARSGITYDEELHIYSANSPLEAFKAHPETPVVADVRRARMAGGLFRTGGRLYRPAQVAVPMYGSGIAFHEVEELSPTRYCERLVQTITPEWDADFVGTHTMNSDHGLSVIDLMRRTPAR